jgi:hypothetical protein
VSTLAAVAVIRSLKGAKNKTYHPPRLRTSAG